jgi:aspartate-semialdehyde dehydrogenase
MVVALAPIHKLYKIRRVIVSTYQAASGAGSKAVSELFDQTKAILAGEESKPEAMPQRIAFNVFPHIGGFAECDYTSEEWKMIKETHKIMHSDKIMVSATTVRVPVRTGHSESIYIETKRPIDIEEAKRVLASSPGIVVIDDTKSCVYPLPVNVEGKDEVFIGRIRRDPYNDKGMWLWVVADNLRKGAATNAVQIAELLIRKKSKAVA